MQFWRRKPKVEVWSPVGNGFYYRAPSRLSVWIRRIGFIVYGGCIALGFVAMVLGELFAPR